LWIDAVQVQACPEATAEFHAAFRDEGIAARERLVDWSPPERTIAVAKGRSITGPTKKAKHVRTNYAACSGRSAQPMV